jgi:hypothetical protein
MLTADEREEFDNLLLDATDNARSDWEEEFVESMRSESKNPFWEPTERQWEKLREIAERDEADDDIDDRHRYGSL